MMTHRKSEDEEVQITALKFTDRDGGSILDLSFNKEPQETIIGTWTTYKIPLGHEIVGLREKIDIGEGICKLGFML